MNSLPLTSSLADFIALLEGNAEKITFEQVMQVIRENYIYTATAFTNGHVFNGEGINEGSCKIFYFAKLNQFTEQQTLACFGQYYREDVLKDPHGKGHDNIRNFIKTGWSKIDFNAVALSPLV
ncbi:MAG: HopJ type III effector protein [Colwellia sp.]